MKKIIFLLSLFVLVVSCNIYLDIPEDVEKEVNKTEYDEGYFETLEYIPMTELEPGLYTTPGVVTPAELNATGKVKMTCYNNTPIIEVDCNGCGIKSKLFTGIVFETSSSQDLALYYPIKTTTKGSLITFEDAFGMILEVRLSQLTGFTTIPEIYDFLGDCFVTATGGVNPLYCINDYSFTFADEADPTVAEVKVWAEANASAEELANGITMSYYDEAGTGSCDYPDFVFVYASDEAIRIGMNVGTGASEINELTDGRSDESTFVFLGEGAGSGSTGASNVGIGINALSGSGDNQNTAVGYNAMANADPNAGTGSNTAVGYKALQGSATPANNTGNSNTAVGDRALFSYTSGFNNTAIGAAVLDVLTEGQRNTQVGYASGNQQTTGNDNTALGAYTFNKLETHDENTAIGSYSLSEVIQAGNTAVGYQAGRWSSTGTDNTFIGRYSGTGQTDAYTGAYENTSVGSFSLSKLADAAIQNTAIGSYAGYNHTIGQDNTFVGHSSGFSNVAKNGLTAIGYQSMYYTNNAGTSSLTANTAVGYQSLRGSTSAAANTGTANTALGSSALLANAGGNSNVAIGYNALDANTGGSNNTSVGANSLSDNTSGIYNTALGFDALRNNGNGGQNTAVGMNALKGASDGTYTGNVGVGYSALSSLTNGSTYNIAIGTAAGSNITSGDYNTLIGYSVDAPSAGSENFFGLGKSTDFILTGDFAKKIITVANAVSYAGTEVVAANTSRLSLGEYLHHVTYTTTGAVIVTIDSNVITEDGYEFVIVDAGGLAGTNNITVETQSTETINGAANFVINGNYHAITFYCLGGNVFVKSEYTP